MTTDPSTTATTTATTTTTTTTTSTIEDLRNALRQCLASTRVSDLQMAKKTVVIDSKTDPKKAIEILIENKIRAAPVIEDGRYVGVLDLRDTVKFALQQYKEVHAANEPPLSSKAMDYFASAVEISTKSLKYLCSMRRFRTVAENANAMVVCKLMAQGCHIVGVLNTDQELIGILSQGQLFQQVCKLWMSNHVFDHRSNTLAELQRVSIITMPVESINSNVSAYDAFAKMSKFNLSGLAVINEDGRIIHNTSAVDIKLWLICSSTLDSSIEAFLINIRKLSVVDRYPITVCTMKDTIQRAFGKLQATKYHRMWITNDEVQPIGVLALTDIFRFFSNEQAYASAESNNNNSSNNNSNANAVQAQAQEMSNNTNTN